MPATVKKPTKGNKADETLAKIKDARKEIERVEELCMFATDEDFASADAAQALISKLSASLTEKQRAALDNDGE